MNARNDTVITVECPECGESERVPIQPDPFGPVGGTVYCDCQSPMVPMEPKEDRE